MNVIVARRARRNRFRFKLLQLLTSRIESPVVIDDVGHARLSHFVNLNAWIFVKCNLAAICHLTARRRGRLWSSRKRFNKSSYLRLSSPKNHSCWYSLNVDFVWNPHNMIVIFIKCQVHELRKSHATDDKLWPFFSIPKRNQSVRSQTSNINLEH